MIPENVQFSTLSNGLKLITINQPWHQGIHCYAYVNVGSCDEQLEGDKGICHFIEHMVFRGTIDYTKAKIDKMITGRGGYYNGSTSYSYTKYNMWTQKQFFQDTISILDNIIFKPIINIDELNIEREIIIEEAMKTKSDPFYHAFSKSNELLYPKHNYRFPIIGTEKSINHITSTRIKEYLRGYYKPQTIILTLCGNIPEQQELEDILYNNANGFIRKTRASNSSVFQRNFGNHSLLLEDVEKEEYWENIKSSFSITGYTFNAKNLYKKERIAINILNAIIGGNSNSMMFKQIRNNNGLCYSCNSSYILLVDHIGAYYFILSGRNQKIQQAEKNLDMIIKDILKGKISNENFEEAKNSLLGSHLRGLESGSYFSQMLSNAFVEEDNEKYQILPWEYENLIKKTNKKQIIEMAKFLFSNNYKIRYRILNNDN